MNFRKNLFSLPQNADSFLAALLGFLLIQVFSKHSGIGISPDSVTYLSTARNLIAGHGWLSFEEIPTVDFPLAYPTLLAVISWITGLDPLQFAPVLNGILFGLLLFVSGRIMNGFGINSTAYSVAEHRDNHTWYKRIILLCILLSPAMQEVYSMLWSETLFLPEILIFIYTIKNYRSSARKEWLLLTILICALSCVTRYAGIFLVPTGLILIFFNWNRQLKKRIIDSFLFGILSVIPFLTNIFRNIVQTGTATGLRVANHSGIREILENFGLVISDWLLIRHRPVLEIFLFIVVILIFLMVIRKTTRKNQELEYVVALTGLSYALFMVFTSVLTRYEPFSNRLLSPLYILLLWSSSNWIPGRLSRLISRKRLIFGLFTLLLAAWFLNTQLRADYEYYDGVKDAGMPGYTEDPFVKQEITQWVEKNKSQFSPGATIYSNAGDAVYFVSGLSARQLPFNDFPEKINDYLQKKNTYLIWFNDPENLQMPSQEFILAHKNFVLIQKLSDGAVYFNY